MPAMADAPDRIWLGTRIGDGFEIDCWSASETPNDDGEWKEVSGYIRADLYTALQAQLAEVEAERDEARRRRDKWKVKAEGFDAVRRALREKVGEPWPPNLSRVMWAGIAADERARAGAAETALATARADALREAARAVSLNAWRHGGKDSYSAGMDAGARHQNAQDHAAILALLNRPADPTPPHRRSSLEHERDEG